MVYCFSGADITTAVDRFAQLVEHWATVGGVIDLWDVKEPTHYSQRVGYGVAGYEVCYLQHSPGIMYNVLRVSPLKY